MESVWLAHFVGRLLYLVLLQLVRSGFGAAEQVLLWVASELVQPGWAAVTLLVFSPYGLGLISLALLRSPELVLVLPLGLVVLLFAA